MIRVLLASYLSFALVSPTYSQQLQNKQAYRQYVLALLLKQVRYPPAAIKQQLEGSTVIIFRLTPNGRLVSKRVVQSSGHPILDGAALAAVDRVRSFPRITTDMVNEPVDVTMPVKFELR